MEKRGGWHANGMKNNSLHAMTYTPMETRSPPIFRMSQRALEKGVVKGEMEQGKVRRKVCLKYKHFKLISAYPLLMAATVRSTTSLLPIISAVR